MECMNDNIAAADEAIAELVSDLCREFDRGFKSYEEKELIIARVTKLRASMNPNITQIIHR